MSIAPQGGYNAHNLNGARGGLGEDVGGHCGSCGGALAIVVKRIDLARADGKWQPHCADLGQKRQHPRQQPATAAAAEAKDLAPTVLVGAVSLVPADAVGGGFRADTVGSH